MAQVCDYTYFMMIEKMERWAMVGQVVAAIAILGGNNPDVPDPVASRAEFDHWLNSPLDAEPEDRQQRELEAALGIGR